MIELTLLRGQSTDQGTPGQILTLDGRRVCFSLELPWRNNATGRSCIPPGRYRVTYLERSASGKYRDVYHVQGVEKRVGILMHKANFAGDKLLGWKAELLGCIAPAKRLGVLPIGGGRSQMAAIDSRGGLSALHAVVGRKDFILEIKQG